MKLKNVLPIIAMLLVVFITGCKKDDFTGERPMVTSTDPINEATSISINSMISATFSMDMKASTITSTSFTLKKGAVAVTGLVESTGKMATFIPAANLDPNTLYTATITTAAKNIAGVSLANNYVWSFTTSEISDLTPPTVTLSDPAGDETGVALNHLIVVTFSEPMDPNTITTSTYTLKQGLTSVVGAVTCTGSTATFTPSSSLEPNKVYSATITTGVKDMAGNALASNHAFSFTTGNAADIVLPMVNSTDPLNNATAIAINKVISLTFSEAMDPATINTSTLTLKQGETSVTGIVALNVAGTTATFTPSSNLANGMIYTVTITTGAKDLAGNALAANTVWTFTTVTAPPTVILINPLNLATSVVLNKVISATFNTAMDQSTITTSTFTLMDGTTPVTGVVSYTGMMASFTPNSNLASGKTYTAKITTGARSAAGVNLVSDFTWTFTTVFVAPTILSVDPLNLATNVAVDKVISVNFSTAMNASTITSSTFTLKDGVTPITGAISYSGTTATFTPSSALLLGKTYRVTVTTGVKNAAGTAISSNYSWTFSTGASIAPTVLSTNPLDLAINVLLSKVVTANFSVAMDPLTITTSTFTLMDGTTPVLGVVTYSGTTASFTPSSALLASKTYTATITTGAKNVGGTALEFDEVWSFTTIAGSSGQAVVELGTAANYVILAKTAISNISISDITGDLGLSPAATSYITGFSLVDATGYAESSQITGKVYAADMATPTPINLTTAVENMITAYNGAAGRPTPDFLELGTGNIGGMILTPGLYKWTNTVTLPSDVTISGDANDVWIFQIAGDLLVSNGVNLTLEGGAQAKNIFWQVAGQATCGTTSHFEGIILSKTGITFQTGASFKGRALAQTAVSLDGNAVIGPE